MQTRINWTICIGCIGWIGCSPAAPTSAPPTTSASPYQSTPMIFPGLKSPPMKLAVEAGLADDTPILGVVIDGKARAYSVPAMSKMNTHVVNDLVGDVPLTMTYCDRTDCVMALTSTKRGQTLPIDVGGFDDGLLIREGTTFFHQKTLRPMQSDSTAKISGTPVGVERMSWKEWKQKHPETLVFVGAEK